MFSRDELYLILATVPKKRLKYKYIMNQISIPVDAEDYVRFQVILDAKVGVKLYFIADGLRYEFRGNVADIIQSVVIGTRTKFIMVGETVFDVTDVNFEALKESEAHA